MVNPNQVDSARRAVIKERGGIVVSIPQTCFRVAISLGRRQDSVENLQVLVFPLSWAARKLVLWLWSSEDSKILIGNSKVGIT